MARKEKQAKKGVYITYQGNNVELAKLPAKIQKQLQEIYPQAFETANTPESNAETETSE